MKVLGIESSCDETACAIVEDGRKILSNVVATQIPFHQIYKGVVPEIASRKHAEWILPVVRQSLEESHLTLDEVDAPLPFALSAPALPDKSPVSSGQTLFQKTFQRKMKARCSA